MGGNPGTESVLMLFSTARDSAIFSSPTGSQVSFSLIPLPFLPALPLLPRCLPQASLCQCTAIAITTFWFLNLCFSFPLLDSVLHFACRKLIKQVLREAYACAFRLNRHFSCLGHSFPCVSKLPKLLALAGGCRCRREQFTSYVCVAICSMLLLDVCVLTT